MDGHAGEPVVKTFHCRHPGDGAEKRREKEREALARAESQPRQAMTVSCRQLAADAQPPQGQREGKNERDAAGEAARRMRDIVVGVVGEGEVADDVDQDVRHRGCGRSGAGSQRKRRSKSQTHRLSRRNLNRSCHDEQNLRALQHEGVGSDHRLPGERPIGDASANDRERRAVDVR